LLANEKRCVLEVEQSLCSEEWLQAFSTASALIVSLLIMIVGSGSAKEADDLGVLVA